jgi:hypothetical protein
MSILLSVFIPVQEMPFSLAIRTIMFVINR